MGNILNRAYITNLQQNMRELADNAFSAVEPVLNYPLITSVITDEAESVQLILPIDADTIDHGVDEGEISFSSLEELNLVFNYEHSTKGLEIRRSQFTDGPRGAKRAADWARKMGADAAYTPEMLVWRTVVANPVTQVDQLPLFDTAHLNNPKNSAKGTYANLFTGAAASGSPNNPGALRIDAGVAEEDAFENLGKALAAIRLVKCADGITPRHLRARYLFVDPTLEARARLLAGPTLLNSTDYAGVSRAQGLQVVVIPELASDNSWYLGVEEIAGSETGALVYWEREPFTINYLDGLTDAQLSAMGVFQWHGRGREAVYPGLPFKLYHVLPA